jgi:hypothetical protein
MANFQSAERTASKSGTLPQAQADSAQVGAKRRRTRASFKLNAQASGDTLELADLPIGAVFGGITMTSGASLATSTVAVGIAGNTAKYKAAAVFTAVDTPTGYGKAAALAQAPLAAAETLIATIAVAALPNTGEDLVFDIHYTTRA